MREKLKCNLNKKIITALIVLIVAIMQIGILSESKVKADQIQKDKCEMNITLKNGDITFADREVRIYKIAEKNEVNEYNLTGAFAKYPIEINDIKNNSDWSKISNIISGYIISDGITADYTGTTNKQGKIKYENLQEGLYLMIVDDCVEHDKLYEFAPQIIAIPYINENNKLQQSVDVEIKNIAKNIESKEQQSKKDERKEKSKENTNEKQRKESELITTFNHDSKLPQTGQDKIITVILAAVGLMMVAGGVVIIKKNR